MPKTTEPKNERSGKLNTFFKIWIVYALVWCFDKARVSLTSENWFHELKCWSLHFLDSQFCPYDIYYFRPIMEACVNDLKYEFPHGSSWDFDLKIVELTPENMTEYFSSTSDALDHPFIIRGFLRQPGTVLDLTSYADLDFLRASVNSSHIYSFASKDESFVKTTMPDAIDRMLQGEGLYMKFNRDFTNFEGAVNAAVNAASAKLCELAGPKVSQALEDSLKVTFFTIGDQMMTPLHNAMSDNWFFQIAGTKDWDIYDPRHYIYLQPYSLPNAIASGSSWDPTFDRGPRPLKVRTHGGDFLYFPSFWQHDVKNVGPGLKLAVGLRPSISGVKGMMKTALLPFFEHRAGTTAQSINHMGPAVKILIDTFAVQIKGRVLSLFGDSEVGALTETDNERGRNWWKKIIKKQGEQKSLDELTQHIDL